MLQPDYPILGAEIAIAGKRFQHPQLARKPATVTQSAQTTIPSNRQNGSYYPVGVTSLYRVLSFRMLSKQVLKYRETTIFGLKVLCRFIDTLQPTSSILNIHFLIIQYGIGETKFNSRYTNRQKYVKNRKHKTDTELSNEIWKLKEQNKSFDISLEILGIYQSFNTTTKQFTLFLIEKLTIVLHKQDNILLNKSTKVISKYAHSNKYNLANYDAKD